jgi:lysophospholipase L1-like esterase
MRKTIKKKFILSGLIIITGFLGLEFVTRAIYPERIARLIGDRKYYVQTSEIEGLYYELTPNYDKVYNHINSKGQIVRSVRYRINKDGLRDYFYPREKKDAIRIICLGDSFTFGYGVDLEQTYPKILEKKLNEIHSEKYEVINAGVPGYNTGQELILLKEKLIRYEPDIVIIGFCLNDADPPLKIDEEKGLVYVYPKPLPFYLRMPTFLKQKSRFINLSVNICKGLFANSLGNKSRPSTFNSYSWKFTKSKLKEIVEFTRSRNVRLIIVLIPDYGYTQISRELAGKLLEDFCKINNISFLDLTPSFREEEITSGTELFLPEDGHPNPTGHSVISGAILKKYL